MRVQARFDGRVPLQEVERPRERRRGRLVSGEENRERLVANLRVAHAAAHVVVARGDERREDVVAVSRGGPVLANHALDDGVDDGLRAPEAPPDRQRQSRPVLGHRQQEVRKVAHRALERPRERLRIGACERRPEQRLRGDRERELARRTRDVDRLAVVPARDELSRAFDHHARVVGDSLAAKRRLHESPVNEMLGRLRREEASPEQHAEQLRAAALLERARFRDEYLLDARRIAREPDVGPGSAETHHRAILARHAREIARHAGLGGEARTQQRERRKRRAVSHSPRVLRVPSAIHTDAVPAALPSVGGVRRVRAARSRTNGG